MGSGAPQILGSWRGGYLVHFGVLGNVAMRDMELMISHDSHELWFMKDDRFAAAHRETASTRHPELSKSIPK